MKKIGKILKSFSIFLIVSFVITISIVYTVLHSSLPTLNGKIELEQLKATVKIERDDLGIPSIYAENREDVAFALGFLHAQDRFFQIDLMRRAAAGELSELFGKEALSFDKLRRFHRSRFKAEKVFENLSKREKNLLIAYSCGVNEGLKTLKARPYEYMILGMIPKQWTPVDSLLICYSLFFELQDHMAQGEVNREVMKRVLPEDVYHFFVNNGSVWESALDDSTMGIIPVPGKKSFSYLQPEEVIKAKKEMAVDLPSLGGSNQWAITNEKTYNGKALLACDMHLNLSVPTIWYRAAFHYPENKEFINTYGATLPGTPLMIIGSNTLIAWGFTNGFVPTSHFTFVDSSTARTIHEIIYVKDSEPFVLDISETDEGPILPEKLFGRSIALQWIAHDPLCLNVKLFELEKAKDVSEALNVSKNIRVPILNFLVADRNSNIAWTFIGSIPNIGSEDFPTIINPPNSCLWTANNRTLGGEWLARTGRNCYINGIRAHQISRSLQSMNKATPSDMLSLQLQTKADFFKRWQQLFIDTLEKGSKTEKHNELLRIVKSWNGNADADSSAYFWIREFRKKVINAIQERVFQPCNKVKADFLAHYFQDFEEPLWMIASQHPDYLASPAFHGWNEEFLFYIDEMLTPFAVTELKDQTWGKTNKLVMQHPFSNAVPFLSFLLDYPSVPLSGDFFVPKMAYCNQSASQRMVVSPGLEDEGIFHMPGGQSGHFLSPFYRAGHDDWLEGRASRFLPGKTKYKLELVPSTLQHF